jgi:exopolysaccharide biosynthesis polyprenyl glycosylphosphotransferase
MTTGDEVRDVALVSPEMGQVETELRPDSPAPETDDGPGIVIDLRTGEPLIDLPPTPRQLELFESAQLLRAPQWKQAAKRTIDVFGSLLFLILLSPILVVISLAILTTSGYPIFYRQERIGFHGKPFTFLKFRSMRRDAHQQLWQLKALNEQSGPIFKIKNDPRITRIGRFLRRWSLDELPQLFHVLSGKMSLVGPRPPLPHEVAEYDGRARRRLLAKPGITCIWQVSGRSNLDFETWVSMDLQYIETWSLGLDLRLLVATVPAVLTGRGAY